ncbi:MAG: hypothetical protein J5595_03985, partial [Bacteroidales bacterium]|nr:hypothetical protein [Bacteroidales bacterium]
MDINQIANILKAKKIFGNSALTVERIIIRAATAAALPSSMYFDLRRFKDPANPIERMYKMGVRVFVVVNYDNEMQRNYPDATFIVVENINTAINLYINAVMDAYKGRVIAVPQRGGNCCLKDWMYALLSARHTVFATTRYVDELDFIENVSNINNNFEYAICEIPERYNFHCISHIEQLDAVAWDDTDFNIDYTLTETNADIQLTGRGKDIAVHIPYCDRIHAEDAAHCLCYLAKEGIYQNGVHDKIFETLAIPDSQIKMRDADLNIGIISCFSTVNNIYSISKTFDFLARQHQFEQRAAVIINPEMEQLTKAEFFAQLFFLAKGSGIRKIVFIGYFEQIPHDDD